jgi:hypothetical protein
MPRDDWAKARAKDAARKGRQGNTTRTRKNCKRKISLKAERIKADRLQSWDAKLWFGKFAGKRLRECPQWYLEFLSKLEPTTDNMRHIVSFIQSEISKT